MQLGCVVPTLVCVVSPSPSTLRTQPCVSLPASQITWSPEPGISSPGPAHSARAAASSAAAFPGSRPSPAATSRYRVRGGQTLRVRSTNYDGGRLNRLLHPPLPDSCEPQTRPISVSICTKKTEPLQLGGFTPGVQELSAGMFCCGRQLTARRSIQPRPPEQQRPEPGDTLMHPGCGCCGEGQAGEDVGLGRKRPLIFM